MMPKTKTSVLDKIDACKNYERGSWDIHKIASHYGVAKTTFYTWLKQYRDGTLRVDNAFAVNKQCVHTSWTSGAYLVDGIRHPTLASARDAAIKNALANPGKQVHVEQAQLMIVATYSMVIT